MSEYHFHPIKGQAHTILRAILESQELSSCHQKEALALRLVCEEIVTNITNYAYPDDAEGYMDVIIQKNERMVIRFEDGGIPFNPLEQEQYDTRLPWDQRPVGGLGIFLIKNKMDDVHYAYINQKNVLTIEKAIKEP